jgi:hypothetical protein
MARLDDLAPIKKGSLTQKANPQKRTYVPSRGGRGDALPPIKRGSLTVGRRELLPSKTAQTFEMLEKRRLATYKASPFRGSAITDYYKNANKPSRTVEGGARISGFSVRGGQGGGGGGIGKDKNKVR